MKMSNNVFLDFCKKTVVDYHNNKVRLANNGKLTNVNDGKITEDNVFVVWSCKTIQNNKAILGIDLKEDNTLYEITFNGDRQESYVDVYEKKENFKIMHEDKEI